MAQELQGFRIAILTEDAFEQPEMVKPRQALDDAGAQTTLVSKHTPSLQGWNHRTPADTFPVDLPLDQADAHDFDALLLPGGALNADKLRTEPAAVAFVKAFAQAGKPIAAICHAPWILIEAGITKGRTLTAWPSLQTDIKNSGGTWVDRTVVEDSGLVTSRKPDDIPDFNREMIKLFQNSRGSGSRAQTGTIAPNRSQAPTA